LKSERQNGNSGLNWYLGLPMNHAFETPVSFKRLRHRVIADYGLHDGAKSRQR